MAEKGYKRIFNSSAMMGGVSVATMIFGMVRTKFAAVLIGAGGVGLLAGLSSLQGLISIIAGLGLESSAVREIADKHGKSDELAVARIALSVQRASLVTGLLGAIVMLLTSEWMSRFTFGNASYSAEIAQLSLAILFGAMSVGHLAMIQGMRKIADLAKLQITQALLGTVSSIGCYYWLGIQGVALSLILLAFLQFFLAGYFGHRTPRLEIRQRWTESLALSTGMIGLGVSMMWGALLVSAVMYITNIMISTTIDLAALGIYSAAFTLSGVFINFVLNAMGIDYYPKLSGMANDRESMNRLVNEQTEIGLLLAVPGLLATLALAPWLIQLFYSKEFLPATSMMEWFIMGCLIRLVQWPMGFLQLALGRARMWFATQTGFAVLHLLLIATLLNFMGIEGVAVAFFGQYLISLGVILTIAKRLTGFTWSAETKKLLLITLPLALTTFLVVRNVEGMAGGLIGLLIAIVTGLWGYGELSARLGPDHGLTKFARLLSRSK